MTSGVRVLIWIAMVGVSAGGMRIARSSATHEHQPDRWFIPGALGAERGHWRPDAASSGRKERRPSDAQQSAFLTRAFSGLRGAQGQEWGQRNGLTKPLAFSHHLTRVFPPELYEQHPEFFPLVDGKRVEPPKGSYFWNPDIAREDVARHAAEAARQHFERRPEEESFALGVNDALIWGESPELMALAGPTRWWRERPDYSNVVFTFMNRAATELSRTHPGKYLGALAYYWCENVPDFPVHPQVVPFLTADRAQGYDAAFRKEELELQEKWGRLAGRTPDGRDRPPGAPAAPARRLGMYDYVYGGGFLIPRLHTRLLSENVRHARQVGFTDYYAEVNPNWGLDGPMPWLAAQLLQDPEQPAEALLDEYYGRYFREAAAPMRRFFATCEDLWMAQPGPAYWLKHYRNESQAVVFPAEACAQLRLILRDAAARARSAEARARVRLVSDSFGVTERLVEFKSARDALVRLALGLAGPRPTMEESRRASLDTPAAAGMAPATSLADALAGYLAARREFIQYTVQLRSAQPIALHPFLWDDYLKNDPVPLALLAIRAAGFGSGADRQSGNATAGRLRFNSGELPTALRAEPLVTRLWSALAHNPAGAATRAAGGAGRELLRDAGMTGPPLPARTIAELTYGVALPEAWQSKVEPAEAHRAELHPQARRGRRPDGMAEGRTATARVLRISGTKDTMLSQWVHLGAAERNGLTERLQRGKIAVRGRVSPSNAVSLIIAWLDETHRHVGFKTIRLPDGEWPNFVTLQQAGLAPEGAVWVGLGLRVQNQVAGDWIEGTEFSLTAE